tara:strand:- start:124 stop:378 length:255 start_codon:yes stop_codon:yes gene_type:complete
MNTSITSENETANSLLVLTETYDTINISGVSTIIGTPSEIINIIDLNNFTGFNTSNIILTDNIDNSRLLHIKDNTTGTVVELST